MLLAERSILRVFATPKRKALFDQAITLRRARYHEIPRALPRRARSVTKFDHDTQDLLGGLLQSKSGTLTA